MTAILLFEGKYFLFQQECILLGGCLHGRSPFRKDATPIVESCSCYTCQNHTKAYINHLLNVHEMLAQILLEMYSIIAYLY
jgi:queuine tRNA-ribosyltransferase subunit QTRTD1